MRHTPVRQACTIDASVARSVLDATTFHRSSSDTVEIVHHHENCWYYFMATAYNFV